MEFDEFQDLVKIVRMSILFDEQWYRENYSLSEADDPALHYIVEGWKRGNDPSEHFSTQEYWDMHKDIQEFLVCPLLHYEIYGINERRQCNIKEVEKLRTKHPECLSNMENGLLRLRITNRCNGKCRYCGLLGWSKEEQEKEMEPSWYYDECLPLYDKLSIILITGGDAFYATESYQYMNFMSEKYPQITLFTESNGLAFNKKYQILAAENLFMTHFSLNASNAKVFQTGCWSGPNAELAFNAIYNNIQDYMRLLYEKDLVVFAPNYSMVINRDTAEDVYDFIKLSLELKASYIIFYFDYTENDMNSEYFGNPDSSRPILRMLVEIERVLARKFFLSFRLWIPSKELDPIQKEVDAMDISKLRIQYRELLELASDRNMKYEFEMRNKIRKENGKKELSFDQDWNPTVRMHEKCGKTICASPWESLDLYPNGRIDFCGWYIPMLDFKKFKCENGINWNDIINSPEYMLHRSHILNGNYSGCQSCCPMNDATSEVVGFHDHGYYRTIE